MRTMGTTPLVLNMAQVVAQLGPAAGVVLRVDDRVVDANARQHRDPAGAVAVGNHGAEDAPAFL